MLTYTKQIKNVVQNVAYVQGQTLQAVPLPTDLPISRIIVNIKGTPTGAVGGGAIGVLQNAFTIPALAQALGLFTIASSPRDGSNGISVKQLPATQCFFDSWMMNQQQAPFTDLNVATPATAVNLSVSINFMDIRLPKPQQHLTALEAPRYGGQNTLNLTIFTGSLWAAAGTPDQTAIVGGTYGTPIGVGTLTVTVSVEQLVPLGFNWPAFDDAGAMPFLDRDFEYQVMSGLNQTQSNQLQLNRRGIQANTFFMLAGQAATTFAETGFNNLAVSPIPQLVERLGSQEKYRIDGPTLQAIDVEQFLAASAWPAGVYGVNDWQNNLNSSYSLNKVQGVHQWDTNMGAAGAFNQQVLRFLHITYNPSARAMALKPDL